jgi:hypothetical protein
MSDIRLSTFSRVFRIPDNFNMGLHNTTSLRSIEDQAIVLEDFLT